MSVCDLYPAHLSIPFPSHLVHDVPIQPAKRKATLANYRRKAIFDRARWVVFVRGLTPFPKTVCIHPTWLRHGASSPEFCTTNCKPDNFPRVFLWDCGGNGHRVFLGTPPNPRKSYRKQEFGSVSSSSVWGYSDLARSFSSEAWKLWRWREVGEDCRLGSWDDWKGWKFSGGWEG